MCGRNREKNGVGDDVPSVYFTGEPASLRAVLSERKMIRIFIRERKTNTKRDEYIFHMQIRWRERTEMGQKDWERYAPKSLKLIAAKGSIEKIFLFPISEIEER